MQESDEGKKTPDMLYLPYVQGSSEKVEKKVGDINVRTVLIHSRLYTQKLSYER